MQQLQELNASLNSNERILRESMAEAERTTEEWRKREVPAVDDVLVAPTAVGEQLYGLVAEEKGVEEAMRVLGRALDRGRVTGDVFVRVSDPLLLPRLCCVRELTCACSKPAPLPVSSSCRRP